MIVILSHEEGCRMIMNAANENNAAYSSQEQVDILSKRKK